MKKSEPTAEEITDALVILVQELIDYRARRAVRPFRGPVTFTREIFADIQPRGNFRDLIASPMEKTFNAAFRIIGSKLHEMGGVKLMSTVLEAAADRTTRYSYAASILDHAWVDIGGEWWP